MQHPAWRFGLGAAALPLALSWLAPLAAHHTSLWYAASGVATLLALGNLWRLAEQIDAPFNTAANLVTALREGNYSMRGVTGPGGDASELLMRELNALGAALRTERLDETEASELLEKVMSEIDTAVLAFDTPGRVVLENPAAAALLGRAPGTLAGESAESLGLHVDLAARGVQRLEGDLPGELGPFELRVQPFRYRGREHTLLVLTSLARLLRDEERRAQRRIVLVLSHEINNSLAPIKSLAGRLQTLVAKLESPALGHEPGGASSSSSEPTEPAPRSEALPLSDPRSDLVTGLAVIERRAEHLGRVMQEYAKLARTAEPSFRPIRVRDWVHRSTRFWPALHISCAGPDDLVIVGDEALLDQVLLNLLKNAFEATCGERAPDPAPTAGAEPLIRVSWHATGRWLALLIIDSGSGLHGDIDPFLPFVTSKAHGSGIGLALCREVATAHGGRIELENRVDGPGCTARLTLPLSDANCPTF
jgi:two-component system, NtrC family, nitrogen regulation sensor histidine kinase NtrY